MVSSQDGNTSQYAETLFDTTEPQFQHATTVNKLPAQFVHHVQTQRSKKR